MKRIKKTIQLKNYDILFKIKIQNYTNVNKTYWVLKQSILCHLCINLMSILLKMFIKCRKFLQSMVFFFLKMSHDSSQFLFINLTKKKRECDRKLKWTNFIKIIERKILYKKESERKIFQKKNFEEEIFSKKRKTKVIKKFEKFYNKYLGIMLEIKNNTMIWKFLKQFASNAKPSHYLILSKNSRLYNVNIKISGKTTNLVYVKKEIKQKNSLSRSIMLIRKQILNKNIFFLRL